MRGCQRILVYIVVGGEDSGLESISTIPLFSPDSTESTATFASEASYVSIKILSFQEQIYYSLVATTSSPHTGVLPNSVSGVGLKSSHSNSNFTIPPVLSPMEQCLVIFCVRSARIGVLSF